MVGMEIDGAPGVKIEKGQLNVRIKSIDLSFLGVLWIVLQFAVAGVIVGVPFWLVVASVVGGAVGR